MDQLVVKRLKVEKERVGLALQNEENPAQSLLRLYLGSRLFRTYLI
jgi:hypothetical protein